ncbi:hypothetical protein TWF679_007144 [Orbilia oligospora]|uniref:AAA+ ATPase lid domain-containing protein n=1 Tax=Orbilia oligospora TaxID=2813651 RepID=A0A8H8V857_ORBOL|nr:hypothetical protein TWF679_007144 [Orbilia oligospora]
MRHAGAALLPHKSSRHIPTQPQSASDNIEYKLTAQNAASMKIVERSQEQESTSALNDLCFGSSYPQSQLGARISRTNRQTAKLNASVFDTNYTNPTCTMMTLDSVIFDPTQKQETPTKQMQDKVQTRTKTDHTNTSKTESCLLGSPIPANGSTGIRIDPNYGYIETNSGTNPPARSLHLAAPIDELVEEVDVDSLRQKVRELENQVAELQKPAFSERQTLHRIFCGVKKPTIWLDHPRARNTRRKCQHYEANIPIPDEKAYFKRNKHIHFVVYQDFECCGNSILYIKESGYESSVSSASSDNDDDPGMAQHPFSIISREFAELISLLQARANIRDWDRGFKRYEHIFGPHNCILRYIERIRATILTFNPRQQHLLNLLFDFIQNNFGDEFRQAMKLFSQGYASADTICYLVGPGDVIVGKDNTHSLQAYIVRTWPRLDHNDKVTFNAWSWKFNGLFWKSEINVKFDLNDIFKDTDNVQINRLEYYPLKYGDSDTRDFLERRGFMIDTMTYRKMHPQSPMAKEAQVDDLGERIKDDLPLEGDQILILPSTIYGFHIQEKKWYEADVFLEERILSDLTRNALVSVFLRVLEYYDGILILTSNRVGTFDSAFKSRIQLAIHYENLSSEQRTKIWQGFIERLREVAYDEVDIDGLNTDKNIAKLAAYNLNGRQIRNNITTARQLALFKGTLMNMSHLESVIRVSLKFENYLQKVKSGTDEDIARGEGLR